MPPTAQEPSPAHVPVLLAEVLDFLRPVEGGWFIDCTLGLGGHAEAILAAIPEARLLGLDRDAEALAFAEARLAPFAGRWQTARADFRDLAAVCDRAGVEAAAAVLADLGVSSLQLDRGERGFSFSADAPLDMRMDAGQARTAAELVNELGERELADLIFEYGEERGARRIARAIVRVRQRQPIETTRQLADLVVRALHPPGRWRVHPATRTFQALRIAVNDELSAIEALIPQAVDRLRSGGRLAIISFHSLEDRIVKRGFLRESGRCVCDEAARRQRAGRFAPNLPGTNVESPDAPLCEACGARRRVTILTRKPVTPADDEVRSNPRARSARLRVCERL